MDTASNGNNDTLNFTGRVITLRPELLLISLVMHFLGLALPLALLQIYDRILPSQAYGTATFLIIGVAIAIILEAILRFGRQTLFANIGAKYEAHATMAVLDRLQHTDITEVEKRGVSSVADGLRAIAQVRDFWSGQAGAALYEVPFVIVYIGLIAYIGGWLAIIPLSLFLVAIIIASVMNPQIGHLSQAVERTERRNHDFAWTLFAAIDYLKALGSENIIGSLWRRNNSHLISLRTQLEVRMGWVRENAATFGQLSTVLIVAFGAAGVVAGDLTTGALAACTMLAGRSIGPAMSSLGYWAQLVRVKSAMERVDDLLQLPENQAFSSVTKQAKQIDRGEISIDAPTLFSNAVTIPAGTVVHLDTTETPLASRILTAISGMCHDPEIQLKIDGQQLNEYNRESYRDSVMLVSKELALVPGSILNNLTLYDPRYNAEVEQYCQALGLQSYIDNLPHGVLSEIGAGMAENLDEGIYQRIAIIRALLRQPRVLLLDHAASGIDLDGQRKLAALLETLQGKTTVIIATFNPILIAACTQQLRLETKGEG